MIRKILPVIAAACLVAACAVPGGAPASDGAAPASAGPSIVVMVSFDGMRYDYIDRVPTPAFDRVAAAGVRASGLIPAYPSRTFPNHYTLATGLYPARHGIVDNTFWDPSLDAMYAIGDAEAVGDARWYGGEPLWVAAERQGVTAAAFFWVGSEAPIGGVRPTYWKPYDGDVPYAARVDSVLRWLSLPAPERPRLVMLYFSEPDGAGHDHGPEDPRTDSMVVEADRVLARLMAGIDALPHGGDVHLVIVSDHGMAPTGPERVVYLDDYADLEGVRLVHNTAQVFLYFDGDEARLREVYEALAARLENAAVHFADETPERWHYRGNDRTGDLIVTADHGWVIRMRDWRPVRPGGNHGWDPYWRPMHGIFLASGRGLRAGQRIAAFENVHVYPLVAHLLGLEPAADVDGRLDVLAEILAPGAAVR